MFNTMWTTWSLIKTNLEAVDVGNKVFYYVILNFLKDINSWVISLISLPLHSPVKN